MEDFEVTVALSSKYNESVTVEVSRLDAMLENVGSDIISLTLSDDFQEVSYSANVNKLEALIETLQSAVKYAKEHNA